jgi:hypothetical protein
MPGKRGPASETGEILAVSAEATGPLFLRYVDGFDDVTAIRQLPGIPNHVIWTLGHCGLTMHRVGGLLDGGGIPSAEYLDDDAEESTEAFRIRRICRGSIPEASQGAYPCLGRAVEIFQAALTRFQEAIRASSEEVLGQSVPWHDGPITMSSLIHRANFHTACHAGQIIDLRRGFSMPRVIGASNAGQNAHPHQ